MIEYRLQTFITLYNTRSYTKTAQILSMTQPAVSQHIKTLEAYYKVPLVNYKNRILDITPEGHMLYKYALTAERNAAKIKELLENKSFETTLLKLGVLPTIGEGVLQRILSSYIKDFPDTEVHIFHGNDKFLEKLLINGTIDAAIVTNHFPLENYSSSLLFYDETICVCSSENPLAGQTVSFDDLKNEPLILNYYGSEVNQNLDRILKKYAYSIEDFRHPIYLGNLSSIKEHLSYGSGFTFLYLTICENQINSGQFSKIYVKNFYSLHSYYYCYLKDHLLEKQYQEFYNYSKRIISETSNKRGY